MGRRTWGAALLVVAAVAASYGGALRCGFAYDDHDLLTGNEYLKGFFAGAPGPDGRPLPYLKLLLTSDFAELARRFGQPEDAPLGYYRPVIALTYLMDAAFWGEMPSWAAHRRRGGTWKDLAWTRLNPVGFHLTNLLLHTLNALLVFLLARPCLRYGAALAAALLFAVHPIHTESVTWIAGRTDVAATTFFLLALWLYQRHRRRPRRRLFAASAAAFLMGTFTKEMVATLPAVLVLWEFFLGPRPRRYGLAAAYALLLAPYFLARAACAPSHAPPADTWADVSFRTILTTLPAALGWYLRKLVFPPPFDLYPMLSFRPPGAVEAWLPWLALHGGLLAAAWWGRRRLGLPVWALAALYASFAPLTCLVPGLRLARFAVDIEFPVSERFLYLPSLFFVLLVGGLAARWRWVLLPAGLAVLLSVPLVWERNRDWRWNLPLFAAGVRAAPKSIRMRLNYGAALLYDVWEVRAGRRQLEEARRIAAARGEILPLPILNNLVRAYFFGGDYPTAAAVEAARFPYLRRDPQGLRDSAVSLVAYALLTGNAAWLAAAEERLRTLARIAPPAAREVGGFVGLVRRDWGAGARERLAEAYAVLVRSFAGERNPYYQWQTLALLDAGLLRTGAMRLRELLRRRAAAVARFFAPFRARYGAKPALRYLEAELAFWRWRWLGVGEAEGPARTAAAVLAAEPDHLGAARLLCRLRLRQGRPREAGAALRRVARELLREDRVWAGRAVPPEPERVMEFLRWVWFQLEGPRALRPVFRELLGRLLQAWERAARQADTWEGWNRFGIRATQAWEIVGEAAWFRTAEEAFLRAVRLAPEARPPRLNLQALRRRRP